MVSARQVLCKLLGRSRFAACPSCVAVVKKGRVVEQGTHDQLVDQGGTYAALVAMQQAEGGPGGEDDDDEEDSEASALIGGGSGRDLQRGASSSMQLPGVSEASPSRRLGRPPALQYTL
jgi:hypothetical protein